GRPHFIVLDEAHHLMPRSQAAAGTLWDRADLSGFVLVTVHPEHMAVRSLARVTDALVVGQTPLATLRELAAAAGAPPPPGDVDTPLPAGEALHWRPGAGQPPLRLQTIPPAAKR